MPSRDFSDTEHLRRSLIGVCAFTALLWLTEAADAVFTLDLERFGVFPREPWGLIGILVAPLIHGNWYHLFANTLPLVVLGTALIYTYPRTARLALPLIYVGAGLGTWLFARSSYHIGASGLTHGLMFLVFTLGVLRWDRPAIAVSLIIFFLYGSMIWGIFPSAPGISFESHLFGALSGLIGAFLLRNADPRPAVPRYEWEGEDSDEDDDDLLEPPSSDLKND